MSRHNIFLATLTGVILSITVVAVISLGWFSSGSKLIVLLRCNGDMTGTLSITALTQEGIKGSAQVYKVKSACKEGSVEFTGYEREKSLQIEVERDDGKTVRILTEYGTNIQASHSGELYAILKLMDVPPFVANDSI